MRMLTLTVSAELAGRTVKSLLLHRLAVPEGMIARIKLRERGICRNGVRCRTTDRVEVGDVLTVEVGDAPAETGIVPMAAELPIVYEDEDLIVVNKPAGMATHGKALWGDCTVANALAAYWGTRQAFHPVTRLDRGTSGLLVAAKSGYAHERLRSILHTEGFCREYLALALGTLPERQGSITLPIAKAPDGAHRFQADAAGMEARTDYTLLERRGELNLLRLRLYTGRTHQIRVHLAALGCPLAGDWLYGEALPGLERPALHSAFLNLTQPITGEKIELSAALPPDMEELWQKYTASK